MGNEHAKPSDRLRYIDREVNSLRSSLRSSTRSISKNVQEQMVQDLARFSTEANKLRGRVKESRIDDTQRNISYAVNEVLTTKPSQTLDQGAVETDSIVQMPVHKRHSTSKGSLETPAKKTKSSGVNKPSIPSLENIDVKLKTLKPQIAASVERKDSKQLRSQQETIKSLATYLEMISVPENSPLGEKKERLITTSTSLYQKINKAMKEIRRHNDIAYLTNHSQKEQTLKELETLKQSLDSTDIMLQAAVKNEDPNEIQSSQKTLSDISEKLLSIETTDEESKNMKLLLTDKIKWLKHYINELTNKKGSQSDLTKAQASYEDLIKTIASGENQDDTDIKVKLQSLQTFVGSIKEDDERDARHKSQLLNNIIESYSLVENRTESRDQVSVPSRTQVEEFLITWKRLEVNLMSSRIPKQELNRIDDLLKKVQNSIHNFRRMLESNRLDRYSLSSKINLSTPNLSSTSPLHSKSVSSYSIDRSENLPIRTRAKVYQIDSPQIQSINQQLQSLRVQDNGFAQIHEIDTQVNYIKEKFHESQNKQHLKNKLESYVEILRGYTTHYNPATVNKAKKVLDDVNDLLRNVNERNVFNQRRTSIEDVFENVVVLQEQVDDLEREVDRFSGKVDDDEYHKIREKLIEHRRLLQSVEVPQKYDMITKQREQVLKKVTVLIDTLEKKASNTYREDSAVREMKKTLKTLKEKVNRFTGSYKGVLYNQIEKDLNKLLLDASEKLEDKPLSDLIVKDTEKYLKILEHRATRDQSFRFTKSPKTEDEENLLKLKMDLQNIKKDIDTTPSNGINLFLGLKSRLDLVKLGLDQLKHLDENDEPQKDILHNEVETLKNVVDAKIALSQQSIKQWPLQEDRKLKAEEELGNIEESMNKLKKEIENFVGTTSDNRFYELDESSIKLILRMDNMDFPKGSELHDKKIALLKEIYHCGDLLDKRAKETEDLIQFEREIEDVENNFERYTKSTKDLEKLAERVTVMRSDLNNNNFNRLLKERQRKCCCRMDEMVKQINKRTGKNDPEKQLTRLEQQLKSVIKEIDCFSGTHVDRRYYELEGSISEIFSKVDTLKVPEGSELHKKKQLLLKEIHNYNSILDKKAKATEVYRELRKKLDAVRTKLENSRGAKEELKVVDNELKAIKAKLEQATIKDDLKRELSQKFDSLMSKLSSVQSIGNIVNYIGSSSFIADVEKNKVKAPNDYLEHKLNSIESELNRLREKIKQFNDVESSGAYKQLDDDLLKINNQLKKLNVEKENQYYTKKQDLKQKVVDSLTLLDDRAQNVENILEIENALDDISKQIQGGDLLDHMKNKLDEELIGLQVKIGKMAVSEDMQSRLDACKDRVHSLLKKLKKTTDEKVVLSSDDDSSGTFV